MWRGLFLNRVRRRSGYGYGRPYRRAYFGFSFAATLILVCFAVLLGLYLLRYLEL